ncbi:hypothetical protein N5094_07070 [Shewanella putrefaciens]|uniref:hypothetical protein n=1 Tax=Shewanella TaxID=22 RepID=UPI0021BE7ED6|nr:MULTISPECIES: hypothetical protein [Shewanella]MCU8094343.1 hypothetical protein [Shewanella sp. SM20]UXK09959.1 hypothetical protein N5094_07070 [Shewanella putrefaciens]
MLKGIDLFAGAGAKQAGVNIVWASNHSLPTVKYHALNHPELFLVNAKQPHVSVRNETWYIAASLSPYLHAVR